MQTKIMSFYDKFDSLRWEMANLFSQFGISEEEVREVMRKTQDRLGIASMFQQYLDPGEKLIVFLGSARTKPGEPEYEQTRECAVLFAKEGMPVLTGAGPGQMEAASRGATETNGKVFGLQIRLPFEAEANPYVKGLPTNFLCKRFETRIYGLYEPASALIMTPGGIGTLQELFTFWTDMQCGISPIRPIILLDPATSHFWDNTLKSFESIISETGGSDNAARYISQHDLNLVFHTHSPQQAVDHVKLFYRNFNGMKYGSNTGIVTLFFKHEIPYKVMFDCWEKYEKLLPKGKKMEVQRIPFSNGYFISAEINRSQVGQFRSMIDYINRETVINGKTYAQEVAENK